MESPSHHTEKAPPSRRTLLAIAKTSLKTTIDLWERLHNIDVRIPRELRSIITPEQAETFLQEIADAINDAIYNDGVRPNQTLAIDIFNAHFHDTYRHLDSKTQEALRLYYLRRGGFVSEL